MFRFEREIRPYVGLSLALRHHLGDRGLGIGVSGA